MQKFLCPTTKRGSENQVKYRDFTDRFLLIVIEFRFFCRVNLHESKVNLQESNWCIIYLLK